MADAFDTHSLALFELSFSNLDTRFGHPKKPSPESNLQFMIMNLEYKFSYSIFNHMLLGFFFGGGIGRQGIIVTSLLELHMGIYIDSYIDIS